MKRYNIVMQIDASGGNLLMCRRMKPPYQGLYNLPGGKAEPGEPGFHAAYRELREETGVTAADVTLTHLATFSYAMGGAGLPAYDLESYVGRLNRRVEVKGEENPLLWMPLTENFFDMTRFAGEGSIGHVVECVRRYCSALMEPRSPEITLTPLAEDALPVLAYYKGCTEDALRPMLTESRAKCHDGRYYEQFAIRQDGCMVGLASLYAHADGTVSDGVEVFPPFRRCGFAVRALRLLEEAACACGYRTMTAQVRTDNAASIALHEKAGFTLVNTCINRRGREVHEMMKQIGGER